MLKVRPTPAPLREADVQKLVAGKFPKAKWFVYEPVDFDIHREAATLAFGKPVKPYYRLEQAKRIVPCTDGEHDFMFNGQLQLNLLIGSLYFLFRAFSLIPKLKKQSWPTEDGFAADFFFCQ